MSNEVGPAGLSTRMIPLGSSARGGIRPSAGAPIWAETSRTMKSVISSTERSLEKPAASRWPPPPDLRAIALTSTSSTDERRETFRAGPPSRGGSRISAETSAALDRAQEVDDPLGVRLGRADRLEVVAQEVRDDDLPSLEHPRPVERAREQLQLRELDVLVHALEHTVHVGARLHEVGREPQRLRGRVRVLEAPGVGDERDVEGLGDLGRQLDAELAEDVREHLAGRRRVRDDEVHVAEARVVVVVVDVDRERRPLDEAGLGADAARARAVDRDEDALSARRPAARAGAPGRGARGTGTHREAAPARRGT